MRSETKQRAMTTTEIIAIAAAMTLGVVGGFVVTSMVGGSDSDTADAEPVVVQENVADDPSTAVADEIRQLREDLLAEVREQIANEKSAVSNQPRDNFAAERAAQQSAAADAQRQEMGQRTLAYWNELNNIMLREEQMRKAPMGGLTAQNVKNFLKRRGQANKYAADAIHRLPTELVDPAVIAQASAIAGWYNHGSQVNDTADHLVSKGSGSERRGAPGEAWKQAEQQHNQSVDDINRRGDELRQQMIQKYGLPFPDLR